MRIGVRAHDFGCLPPQELARILQQGGYNTAQLAIPKAIAGAGNLLRVTDAQLDEIRTAFSDHGIQIAVLGCYVDLSSPDEAVRTDAVNRVCRSLAQARRLGALCVGTETSYDHLDAAGKEARRPAMIRSVRQIVAEAERLGQDFAVEPVDWYPLDSIPVMRELLDAVDGSPRLRMIFDPANVITPAAIGRQGEVWRAWLEAFGNRITALHIKDFVWDDTGTYCPRLLGEGRMDYTVIADWLRAGHSELPLLREETIHSGAAADLAFLRGLVQ